MGFANLIGGFSSGLSAIEDAWDGPRRAKDALARTKSAAEKRELAQQGRADGLLNEVAAARVRDKIALQSLPTQKTVAIEGQDLNLRGKGEENKLAQSNQILNANLLGQTIGKTAEARGQFEGAKAAADVTRMDGWASGPLPAFRENVIAPAQQHELSLMDRTFGGTAPLELAGQLEREQMGLQKEMFDKERQGRLPEWLIQAAGLATGAGSLFMR